MTTNTKGTAKAISRHFGDRPVVDAKKPLSIRITANDIACSVPADPHACAMAQAAKRAFEADDVLVSRGTTWLQVGDHVERFVNPSSLRHDVIERLDAGEHVVEGMYTLLPPSKGRRRGEASKRRADFERRVKKGEAEHHPHPKKVGRPRKVHTERLMSVIGKH